MLIQKKSHSRGVSHVLQGICITSTYFSCSDDSNPSDISLSSLKVSGIFSGGR